MKFHDFLSLSLLPLSLSSAKLCPMPYNSSPLIDDSPAITTAVTSCGANSTILFQPNVTYNLLTPLSFRNLDSVTFSFEGNVSLSDNVTAVQLVVNNTNTYPGRWIKIQGTNITFQGSESKDGGWFLAHGERWWSMQGDSSQGGRPHWFGFTVTGLKISNIKVLNPVAWVFSIGGSDVEMRNVLIDARSTDGFPFNTDGIDLSASNVLIDGLEVHNGDDVINVSPPAANVTVRNVIASGTHGLSVSCSGNSGGNYTFENAYIYDSLMAARFKGAIGKTCNISDVTWKNIEVKNVSFPIHFIADYYDQEKGIPAGTNTSISALASRFSWQGINGSVAAVVGDGTCVTDPCWYATTGESPNNGMYLLCHDHAHCEDFHFEGIDLTTAKGAPAGEICTGLEGVEDMGISCVNGTIPAN
ncbi:c53a9208-42f8-4475-88ac-1a29c83549a5 [Sclerotinia trifoliorum]|uniref:C53a9208-42f8-4475-88ac-1a29c83549a5 n=1 Tax=Sclerotinia trifoliorum TaxID=28548 RepID=A0A8H2ZV28_9HELO|nr:c53a9208-42f8-4475-88ac-1a29c83549a5 [Sclerotinia trifoliorum]